MVFRNNYHLIIQLTKRLLFKTYPDFDTFVDNLWALLLFLGSWIFCPWPLAFKYSSVCNHLASYWALCTLNCFVWLPVWDADSASIFCLNLSESSRASPRAACWQASDVDHRAVLKFVLFGWFSLQFSILGILISAYCFRSLWVCKPWVLAVLPA